MRTASEHTARLAELLDIVGDENREAVEAVMDDVRSDYEEATGYLAKYGNITDGAFEASDDYATNWREKYEAEKERYRKRWMDGIDVVEKAEGADIDPSGADETKIRSYAELLGREEE